MLKRLAMLACYLSTFLLLLPFGRAEQSPKTSSAAQSQKPADSIPPIATKGANTPATAEGIAEKQTGNSPSQVPAPQQPKNGPRTVSIANFPTKDKYDFIALAINGLLASVGIVGVGVGICTLGYLRTQAKEMQRQNKNMVRQSTILERQADQMEKQAIEARESAAQTFAVLKEQTDNLQISAKAATANALTAEENTKNAKERERARLAIRLMDQPELSSPGSTLNGDCALRARVYVENLGRSKAFGVRANGMLEVRSRPVDEVSQAGFLQVFPQIVDEGAKIPLNLGGFGREHEEWASTADYTAVSFAMASDLREGKIFIYACGMLAYEDIFGDSHTTPFRFVWHSVGDDDGQKWLTRSFWMDISGPST